ncbi:MAG: hypothetical protein COB45_09555 [Gammaproteobacteria bacterium]|nr:MAG: hypothetical protein COB45_09555 [Gammaproteobacteria bacterium]PHR84135.1 MAG: hypothetical protein COA59_07650 [Colwellia sp.]
MTKQKRPTYSAEFKLETAQLVLDGEHKVKEAAELMNVSKSAINKWVGRCIIHQWSGFVDVLNQNNSRLQIL